MSRTAYILLVCACACAACTRADSAAVIVTPGAVYAASAAAAMPAYIAPTDTPTPPPTITPHLRLTELAVEAQELAISATRQAATQRAALDEIARAATQAAADLSAAADAQAMASTQQAAGRMAQADADAATATAQAMSGQATRASAYALTALPAAATEVSWRAVEAQAQAETARRITAAAATAQAGLLVGLFAALGVVLARLLAWAAMRRVEWRASSARAAMLEAEVEGKRAAIARALDAALQPSPAAPSDAAIDAARHAADWRAACKRIAMYAHEFGSWSYDDLGPQGAGVVSRPAWDRLTDYLRDCGYIEKREKSRTRWAAHMDYDGFLSATRQAFPRPFPSGPAPVVRSTDAQTAQTHS